MLANGGRVDDLFRGAILESGSQALGPRFKATDDVPTQTYQLLLKNSGCSDLACLRSIPAQKLLDAQVKTSETFRALAPFTPVRDRYFVRELPSAQFAAGRFPNIPFIDGNNLDEGTLFSISSITTDATFDKVALALLGPNAQPLLPQLKALYPDDPVVGSPFDAPLFGRNSTDRFYPPSDTNQYKRASAMLGDGLFHAGRRQQLQASRRRVNCWSYLFSQPSPETVFSNPALGSPTFGNVALGVAHASELPFVFAKPPNPFTGPVTNASSIAAAAHVGPADIKRTSDIMSAAWIHFAHRLSPAGKDVPTWPAYSSDAEMLQIQGVNGTKVITDDFRKAQIQFFLDHPEAFNI